MALLPPGGLTEIVFSFDTTGSMSSIIDEVKGRLQDMMQRLQADIPGIHLSVFAHGDYCDVDHYYVTKHVDFTNNIAELCGFINDVEGTGGGDFEECYELVLRKVREELSWQPESNKILVVIGDATPHEPDYHLNELNIDWKEEVRALKEKGVKIYGVQCMNNNQATSFFQSLADETGGRHLKLNQFSNIFDVIMAICYREKGAEFLQDYEAEVRARDNLPDLGNEMEGVFGALRDAVTPPHTPVKLIHKAPAAPPAIKKAHAAAKGANMGKAKKGGVVKMGKAAQVIVKKPKPAMKRLKQPFQKMKMRKLTRELVPKTNFKFRNLYWSSWKLVLSSAEPKNMKGWKKQNGGTNFKRKVLFHTDNTQCAIYEFSTQAKALGKRKVVFYCSSNGLQNPTLWQSKLFRYPGVRKHVADALENNCRIFVRRVIFRGRRRWHNLETTRKVLRNMYTYAWR